MTPKWQGTRWRMTWCLYANCKMYTKASLKYIFGWKKRHLGGFISPLLHGRCSYKYGGKDRVYIDQDQTWHVNLYWRHVNLTKISTVIGSLSSFFEIITFLLAKIALWHKKRGGSHVEVLKVVDKSICLFSPIFFR